MDLYKMVLLKLTSMKDATRNVRSMQATLQTQRVCSHKNLIRAHTEIYLPSTDFATKM